MNDNEVLWVDTRPDIATIFEEAKQQGLKNPEEWEYMYSTFKDDIFKNKIDGKYIKISHEKERPCINKLIERDR